MAQVTTWTIILTVTMVTIFCQVEVVVMIHSMVALGNDTYIVDRPDIEVYESGMIEGDFYGIDTVLSSITYTLPDNVENLTLTGTSANRVVPAMS